MKQIFFIALFVGMITTTQAQSPKMITRIARITVDSMQLEAYMKLLRTQMNAAVQQEPGVISYQVFADKTHPSHLTLLEVYADEKAYLSHRETAHFKQYKSASANMVLSLELTEVEPVLSAGKKK
jgi:quinol monooxygenase YgiN